MEAFKRKKMISELQLGLTLLFVVALVVSNIITSKQVLLPFNITMTGAVFIFPMEPFDLLLRVRSKPICGTSL